jgi:glycosyltransferase involved in cell wall biosynthesis
MPKLSIIIPTFNSGNTIAACLESIRRQTFSDYEVLVQDGLSKDDTASLTSHFANAHPQMNIRMVREQDQGVYDAMNRAMERATGEWLYFLGSDDELYDEKSLGTMLGSGDIQKADVLYGNVKMVRPGQDPQDAAVYDGPFDLKKLLHKNICHQAILYRREFMRRIGPYNIRYRLFADWDYNLHCWSQTQFRFVDVIVAVFRLGGLSGSGGDAEFSAEIGRNVMEYFDWSLFHPLINSRRFVGSAAIAAVQRSRSPFHYAAGTVLRLMARALRVIERVLGSN